MKTIFKLSVIFILILSVLFIGCHQKKTEDEVEIKIDNIIEEKKSNHVWYCFTNNGFEKVSRIQDVVGKPFVPWTEAVRISSANCFEKDGYAVVNRLGIICFEGENVYLARDEVLFSNRTAGNLVFLNETPLFSLYKSSFFNESIKNEDYENGIDSHYFLIQFDREAKISYPVLNCFNIFQEPNSEVTDFFWDGMNWICSIKCIKENKTSFDYIGFKPNVSLLTISPATAEGNISVWSSSSEEFRKSKTQLEYSYAPERIKSLLAGFAKTIPFVIEVKTAGGCSPFEFINNPNEKKQLKAKAILANSWSAALFEDGTLFLEGALEGKHILRNGKPIAIRLPVLPDNFVYSDFVISGTNLYVAWEETEFYKTGRSGFLKVDLENGLYNKLKN